MPQSWMRTFLVFLLVSLLLALAIWWLQFLHNPPWGYMGLVLLVVPLVFLRVFRAEVQQAIEAWLRKPRIRK